MNPSFITSLASESDLINRYEKVAEYLGAGTEQFKVNHKLNSSDLYASRCTSAALAIENHLKALYFLVTASPIQYNHNIKGLSISVSSHLILDRSTAKHLSNYKFRDYATNAKYHVDKYTEIQALEAEQVMNKIIGKITNILINAGIDTAEVFKKNFTITPKAKVDIAKLYSTENTINSQKAN